PDPGGRRPPPDAPPHRRPPPPRPPAAPRLRAPAVSARQPRTPHRPAARTGWFSTARTRSAAESPTGDPHRTRRGRPTSTAAPPGGSHPQPSPAPATSRRGSCSSGCHAPRSVRTAARPCCGTRSSRTWRGWWRGHSRGVPDPWGCRSCGCSDGFVAGVVVGEGAVLAVAVAVVFVPVGWSGVAVGRCFGGWAGAFVEGEYVTAVDACGDVSGWGYDGALGEDLTVGLLGFVFVAVECDGDGGDDACRR